MPRPPKRRSTELFARAFGDEEQLYARERDGDLWAREFEEDLWARELEDDFFWARAYEEEGDLLARAPPRPLPPTPEKPKPRPLPPRPLPPRPLPRPPKRREVGLEDLWERAVEIDELD